MKGICFFLGALLSSFAADLTAATVPQDQRHRAVVRSVDTVRGSTLANSEEDLGKVEDLIVQLTDGKLVGLVVTASTTAGVRSLQVPYESVTWDETGNRFLADIGKAELGRLPTFRPEQISPFDHLVALKGVDPAMAPPQPASGRMLATELETLKLRFLGGAQDKLRGMALELRTGVAAFVMVSHVAGTAGTNTLHPLPWNAMRVFGVPPATGREPEPEATLRCDRESLAKSPVLTAGVLEDPLYREQVYKHHQVAPPRFEYLR